MNLLGKATQLLEGIKWKVWLGSIAALLACLPLAYCKGQSDGKAIESAKTQKAINRAVTKALEAERKAQANHETREEGRRVSSDALRQKAEDAPEGSKTKAVLDGLRGR